MVEEMLAGLDGRAIGVRRFDPIGELRSQVVVHGATAVSQRYYQAWATHLAERGHRVFTYDYRGVGRSRREGSLARDPSTMTDWMDDAALVQRTVIRRDHGVPMIAVGHSFGGQIAASLRPAADAIVTVGAQGGYVGRFAFPQRLRIHAVMHWGIPALVASAGYLPGWAGLGEDLPPEVARQWARWCRSPRYFLSELPQLAELMARWSGPMLALSFTDDDYASLTNVEWLLGHFEAARIDHQHLDPSDVGLPGIGHFGLFRRGASAALWPRIDRFIDALLGGEDLRAESEREVLRDLQYGR